MVFVLIIKLIRAYSLLSYPMLKYCSAFELLKVPHSTINAGSATRFIEPLDIRSHPLTDHSASDFRQIASDPLSEISEKRKESDQCAPPFGFDSRERERETRNFVIHFTYSSMSGTIVPSHTTGFSTTAPLLSFTAA